MNKITVKLQFIEFDINESIQELKSLKGIIDVNINTDTNELNIEYAKNDFSLYNLKEILNDILPLPATIGFDKYSKNTLNKYTMTLKNLCCEYCLERRILYLMTVDGIESSITNFKYDEDYKNDNFDTTLDITYDKSLLSKDDIIKLENELAND